MKSRDDGLLSHEQLLLLALRDEKGTLERRAGMLDYTLAGAMLAELVLASRLTIASDDRHLVSLLEETPLHEDLLDECLARVTSAKRRRRATHWVSRFAGTKRLRHRIAAGLCRRGVLRESEDRLLLIFKRKAYPTLDPGPERRLLERLRRAIVSDDARLDPRTTVVLALAHATGMLRIHFDRELLKPAKARLERIAKGELTAAATSEAVRAVQAAVIATSVAATTVATMTATR